MTLQKHNLQAISTYNMQTRILTNSNFTKLDKVYKSFFNQDYKHFYGINMDIKKVKKCCVNWVTGNFNKKIFGRFRFKKY